MLKTAPDAPVVSIAREASSIGDLFRRRATRSGPHPAFYSKVDGQWVATSWSAFFDQARRVAHGLVQLGLEPGDRVAILGPTQAPWCHQDMGAQLCGLVSLGIYPKQSPEQIRYLLEHSGARVVFVADAQELDNVLIAVDGLDSLEAIVPWTDALYQSHRSRDPRIKDPATMDATPLAEDVLDRRLRARQTEDLAILVYTSGTTGPPKGAMISHRNILTILAANSEALAFSQSDISLSFLPMAHVAERVLAFYGRIDAGMATAYASSIAAVLAEVAEVQPTIFGSVPRIFEKAYAKIHGEIEKKPPTVQKLFAWAKEVGRKRIRLVLAGQSVPLVLAVQYKLADLLVFKKIRAAFGGEVKQFITGAAPTAYEILEFFWSAGLPIYEVYGMTESTVITHANRPDAVRLGTVGRCLPGIECKIAEDGEVLVRGSTVFMGYFRNPEATAKTIIDGWLHTGDIGKLDADGYLKITDRKKHLIITAGGKNLAPANIEGAIKNSDPLISQVHAHGDRRPYISAIVAPSPIETLEWGRDRGIVAATEVEARTKELMADPSSRSEALEQAMAKVTEHPDFRQRIQEAVGRGNRELARVEQVRRFFLLTRDFSQEQGELTPTMKVKRGALENKFAAQLDRIYTDDSFALEPR